MPRLTNVYPSSVVSPRRQGMLRGDGLTRMGKTIVSPPAGFDWAPPFTVYKNGGAFDLGSFDVSAYQVTGAGIYYVDYATGNDAWPGTLAQPLKRINTAIGKADVDVVYVMPGLYHRDGYWSNNATRSISVLKWPGESDDVIISGHQAGLVWVLDGVLTNTYKTTRSGVHRVLDVSMTDSHGDYYELTERANAAAVDANPGSWYLDGANVLWVRTLDDRMPDADIWPEIDGGGRALGNITIYIEDLTFVGGSYAFWHRNSGAGQTPKLYAKDCIFQFANVGDGVYVQGLSEAILQNCLSKKCTADGFGYHALNAVIPNAAEINCTARDNGTVDGVANDNGSSMHDAGNVVRVNGTYTRNVGPNIAESDAGTEAWCLGCTANDSASDVVGQDIGILASDTTWLDKCAAIGNATDLATGGTMYLRQCTYGTTGGGGAFLSY